MTIITTKFGDQGLTKHLHGEIVSKASPIVHLLGEIDELNSALGLSGDRFDDTQTFLCELMGYLYLKKADDEKLLSQISQMEHYIANNSGSIPPRFVNPKGYSSMARAICRRVERTIVTLNQDSYMDLTLIMKYINRLSDYLFVQGFVVNENEASSDFLISDQEIPEIQKVA